MRKMLLYYFIVLSTLCLSFAQEKKIVCYWNSDSAKHEDLPGYFEISDIDPTICTHIIYNSIWFSETRSLTWAPGPDKSAEFLNLKARNPNVKLLIGVGGPYWGPKLPSNLTMTPDDRSRLAVVIKSFLDSHPAFDGVDFDWQWPGIARYPDDKDQYASFLAELRGNITQQKILSISVAPRNEDIERSYNLSSIIDHVDFINLNSYDLRGYIDDTSTAFHSPYRKNPTDRTPESEWNAVSIVFSWRSRGVPAEKLTLGIPTYGRSFTLSDSNDNGIGSPINGLGRASSFAPQNRPSRKNIIPYSEICYNINQVGTSWKSVWSPEHFTPYATFDEDQWVGYDDELSVLAKIHLALENDLGGLNYATLDLDDFSGNCSSVKFPLIRLGYDAIINGIFDPNPATTSTTPRPGESVATTTETEEITITTEESISTTPTTISTTPTPSTTPTSPTPDPTTPTTTSDTETPSTETQSETTPETSQSSTTSSTTKPSTVSKTTITRTTTTRTTTSENPTPPLTPNHSTYKTSEVSTTVTSSPNLEELTTTSQSTTIARISEESTTTDFKTPPVTPNRSVTTLSSSTTQDGSKKKVGPDPSEEDNTEEPINVSTPIEEDSNEGSITDTTEGDSGEDSSEESSDYSSSEEDETTDGDVEETTNGDGAPIVTNDDTSTVFRDDTTQDIIDTTTETLSIIPDESTTSKKLTTTISSNFICPEANGNFKNPTDCSTFYMCSNGYPYLYHCQPNLYFDEVNNRCDYRSNVPCNI